MYCRILKIASLPKLSVYSSVASIDLFISNSPKCNTRDTPYAVILLESSVSLLRTPRLKSVNSKNQQCGVIFDLLLNSGYSRNGRRRCKQFRCPGKPAGHRPVLVIGSNCLVHFLVSFIVVLLTCAQFCQEPSISVQ